MAQDNGDAFENEENDEIIDPPAIDSKYRMILLAAQRGIGALTFAFVEPEQNLGPAWSPDGDQIACRR